MCLPCTWCAIAPLSCNFVSVCTHVNYKCAPLLAMALSALMCADCKPVAIIPMKKNQKQNKQTLVWTNMMYLLYLQNSFFPPHHWLTPPSGGTPCDINIIYTSLKSTFSGLQYFLQTLRVYRYSFSHCCLPKSRNHAKYRSNLTIAVQSHRSWCQSKDHMWLPISH